MVQRVKEPALSLWQLGLLLWCRFDPLSGNFCQLQAWPKKEKKKKKKKKPPAPFPRGRALERRGHEGAQCGEGCGNTLQDQHLASHLWEKGKTPTGVEKVEVQFRQER